jgi:hypothetical protein
MPFSANKGMLLAREIRYTCFSKERQLPKVRETNFQKKNDFPEFGRQYIF